MQLTVPPKLLTFSKIISDHLHNNAQREYKGIRMTTISEVGKPLADTPSELKIVRLINNRIDYNYYGLDEMNTTVIF